MLSYCLNCRKNTASKNPKVAKKTNKKKKTGRRVLLLKYAVCDSKKLKFIKQQKTIY